MSLPQRYFVLLAGFFSQLLCLGVARFAYTPLLPLMQQDNVLNDASGGYLAAVNYLGYMAGALLAASLNSLQLKDRLYRLGGEEFVLLLPHTDHSGARAALEKVRDVVQAEPLAEGLRVTTSIGAATLDADDDWPRWLARADSALYQAKDEGRDRVSFDGSSRPGERRLRLVSGRPLR